jgi:hypothetical protein
MQPAVLSLTPLLGCGENDVLCAPLPNWAVAVDVRDSVTDSLLVSKAKGAVFLAGVLDDSLRPELRFHLSSDTLLIVGITEGRVEVRVQHPGYVPWVARDVQTRLDRGECTDWVTQELVARLPCATGNPPRRESPNLPVRVQEAQV